MNIKHKQKYNKNYFYYIIITNPLQNANLVVYFLLLWK